jgi:hypothetical protein
MPRLRITQSNGANDSYRVDLEFEADNRPRQTAMVTFDFEISDQDQEGLRWYLEEFLQVPQDPAPTIAARIETRMAEIGADLFRKVFHSSEDARDLWSKLRDNLHDTHVEVVTSVEGATSIPWELIRDPKTDTPLALRAAAFVRAHPSAAQQPQVPRTKSGPIRILLVICRPRAGDDVPFRSVASRLIKGLSEQTQATYQLDVLRPPTFDQLGRVLRRAKADGKPYHIVHFDGHGVYTELTGPSNSAQVLQKLSPVIYSAPRTGPHGFLVFENPQHPVNGVLVDGPALGGLLAETGVTVLVLNACRSAHAEVEDVPVKPGEPANPNAQPEKTEASDDPHERVRTFGTLAQEVMEAGVAGVVAMRYSVYVVTAAQFVADLYAELVRGQTLGAAVTMGRKQLAAKPDRSIAYDPLPLQDWCVPVVYESMPIRLFPVQKEADGLPITIQAGDATSSRGAIDNELPRLPDSGFFGRDETLLALDRAFDTQSVVLLHAYAGSGKTTAAAEFARWYQFTGGLGTEAQAVLFTSFATYKPLFNVLSNIWDIFGLRICYRNKDGSEKPWDAITDLDERRDAALQVLEQIPILWIWDNVEPIAGFPKGKPSAWSDTDQRELADFLRDARTTKAKFLLTSRRDERDWLGDLPRRVQVPPMPMLERVQLARALAEKRGRRITDVDDWKPLLRFTDGNPLTTTVLVGQALRDGLRTKEQIENFVTHLRAGTAEFDDEPSEGRSKSLGASLSYGFDHAFSEDERKQLALLHIFQGFVNVDVLRTMGQPEAEWCLPELRGLTREAGVALLNRAAEVGLLTALGGGYYIIHPAVPWFFKRLLDAYYAGSATGTPAHGAVVDTRAGRPMRAFVEAMGWLGNQYHNQYGAGDRGVIAVLAAEESNLLHARCLARRNGWWSQVVGTMQGLHCLYDHRGRRAEWKKLVDELVPDFADPLTDGPRPGRESDWIRVTHYRVRLAMEMRDRGKAERLQRLCVDWVRRIAEDIVNQLYGRMDLAIVSERADTRGSQELPTSSGCPTAFRDRLARVSSSLSRADRHALHTLAASLQNLGKIQCEREDARCIASFQESLELDEQIGEHILSAICAYNLGAAYMHIPAIRDLEQADRWCRLSIELFDERDRLGRGRCVGQLGAVARARFEEGRDAEEPVATLHA